MQLTSGPEFGEPTSWAQTSVGYPHQRATNCWLLLPALLTLEGKAISCTSKITGFYPPSENVCFFLVQMQMITQLWVDFWVPHGYEHTAVGLPIKSW